MVASPTNVPQRPFWGVVHVIQRVLRNTVRKPHARHLPSAELNRMLGSLNCQSLACIPMAQRASHGTGVTPEVTFR
jgi:hypothetical protein